MLREYVGGYEDWVRAKCSVQVMGKQEVQPRQTVSTARTLKQTSRNKLSYNEMRELKALPTKIEILEREQADITCKLGDAATYHDSPDKIVRLQTRFVGIEKEIMICLTRWDELETKRLAAEQNTRY